MWKKEKRFVVYVYTHFAPLESLSIIKLKCQDSNGFKLNRSPPKLRPQVCVSPELPPFTFAMAGDNCWMVADLLWEHNNKRLRKRFHVFFSPYVSILSVNYMKINMFRVQRDAPRRITIVCVLTIYVHLIKFILRKSVWDYLFREETNSFFWKVGFISFSQQGVERFTVPAFSGSITRDRKRSNIQGSKETVPLMMNNIVNLTSWEVNSRRFKGMYSSLE